MIRRFPTDVVRFVQSVLSWRAAQYVYPPLHDVTCVYHLPFIISRQAGSNTNISVHGISIGYPLKETVYKCN